MSCDVSTLDGFKTIVNETYDFERLVGYKVGLTLTIPYGLRRVVEAEREITDLPIIYDHQKAMTDIPDLGKDFARAVSNAGASAVIGFPQAGPLTQESWIRACNDSGLLVIVGGEMTHRGYKRSDGGYIVDDALDEMYVNAVSMGITHFVVPGNKPERVKHYRTLLSKAPDDIAFLSPGFVAQGGEISEAAKVAGSRWYAIVGRAIYSASNIRDATQRIIGALSV